jgi:hypothetical protein
LKGRALIALRFRRRVVDATSRREFSDADISRLSRSDRLRIDLANMALGIDQLRREQRAAPPPALILPTSFSSLSNLDDRARIVSAFQAARAYADKGLICELRDIDGVPTITLQGAASMIAPFSLFALGHVTEFNRAGARVLNDAGLRGLSAECPAGLDEAAFLRWIKLVMATAKQAVRSVLVYRLSSMHRARVAAALGASHAHVE